MHRAILEACLPWAGWLVAAFAGLWLTVRLSGGRPAIAKIRRLHSCEAGAVQTLSFVLTLPLFIMLVLFIIQVSQLMIGITVVHYAAFAAARAAIVWIPADVPPYEPANTFDVGTRDQDKSVYPAWVSRTLLFNNFGWDREWKYRKVWSAAAIACIPISPSRDMKTGDTSSYIASGIKSLYTAMVPSAANNQRLPKRIENKVSYTAAATWIVISGLDRDGTRGPTYNPYPGYYVTQRDPITNQLVDVWIPWNPNEVGWEDPVTLSVWHKFSLLPGPGRFLASKLPPQSGQFGGTQDTVSQKIQKNPEYKSKSYDGERDLTEYYTVLTAAVTLSNEGLKSVMPYEQPND